MCNEIIATVIGGLIGLSASYLTNKQIITHEKGKENRETQRKVYVEALSILIPIYNEYILRKSLSYKKRNNISFEPMELLEVKIKLFASNNVKKIFNLLPINEYKVDEKTPKIITALINQMRKELKTE